MALHAGATAPDGRRCTWARSRRSLRAGASTAGAGIACRRGAGDRGRSRLADLVDALGAISGSEMGMNRAIEHSLGGIRRSSCGSAAVHLAAAAAALGAAAALAVDAWAPWCSIICVDRRRGTVAAQPLARSELDPPAGEQRRARRGRHHHRRRAGSRGHAARARRCSSASTPAPLSSASASACGAIRTWRRRSCAAATHRESQPRHRHDFSLLGPRRMAAEIAAAQESIAQRHRREPALLSRPCRTAQSVSRSGAVPPRICSSRAGRGAASTPSTRDADDVYRRLSRRWRHGDILLLHDGHAARDARRHAGDPRGAAAAARDFATSGNCSPSRLRAALLMTPLRPLPSDSRPTSCIGRGSRQTLESLARRAQRSRAAATSRPSISTPTSARSPASTRRVCRTSWRRFDCRNNRLAETRPASRTASPRPSRRRRAAGAARASACSSAPARRAFCRPSSPTARATRQPARCPSSFDYAATHNSFSVADYVRRRLRLEGPAVVVSCACASSAKVFGAARRMIEAGLIDAAVVGGVDSLCLTTLYGFHSLQLCAAGLPPVRYRPRRHLDRRGRGVRAARARPTSAHGKRRCAAARRRRIERRLPHVGAASGRRAARGSPCKRRCSMRGARARRDRLHQPARHRHAEQRRAESQAVTACSAPRRPAARPRARPATRSARPARSRR